MPSLYELTGGLLEMRRQMAELQLDPQTIADTIEAESAEFDQKVVGCMMVYDELADDIDVIDSHIKKLTDRRKRIEANREALKARVMDSMRVVGKSRVDHPLMTVVLYRERDESVVIDDPDQLPVSCLKIVPARSEPIKAEVKKLLKSMSDDAAKLFGGAHIVRSDRLEVKV